MLKSVLSGLMLAALALSCVNHASAAPRAEIVIDARNGKVLYARGADRQQHPASLTKMMTLYLTFEAIRKGRLKLDQRIKISSKASRQPPSKMGLKVGQRVKVRDLIRATALKSANDAAMALAEAIGGSERKFARMMTSKAAQLGMNRTTFHNPHGLTRNGHLSTARDMARLARHLFHDYPQYYNLFGRKQTVSMGRQIYNTNRLLRSYAGADGIKTGYTRAAGFNLAASAVRGKERVIVVLLGGRTSRSRNKRVAELLDLGFRRAPTRVALVKPSRPKTRHVKTSTRPKPKPGDRGMLLSRALTDTIAKRAAAAIPLLPERIGTAPRVAPRPRVNPRRGEPIQRPVVAEFRPKPRPANAVWAVELGAFKDRAYALRTLAKTTGRDVPALVGAKKAVEEREIHGLTLYSAQLQGLDERRAMAACESLRQYRQTCRPVSAER